MVGASPSVSSRRRCARIAIRRPTLRPPDIIGLRELVAERLAANRGFQRVAG